MSAQFYIPETQCLS